MAEQNREAMETQQVGDQGSSLVHEIPSRAEMFCSEGSCHAATRQPLRNASSSSAGMTRFKFTGLDLSTDVHPGARPS